MCAQRDPFFDDGVVESNERAEENRTPPVPTSRKSLPNDVKSDDIKEDPTTTPRLPPVPSSSSSSSSTSSSPRTPPPQAAPPQKPIDSKPEIIKEDIRTRRPSTSSSSETDSFESDEDDTEEEKATKKHHNEISQNVQVHVQTQTDQVTLQNVSIQTETLNNSEIVLREPLVVNKDFVFESKKFTLPLVKNIFNQTISSALPIISFCQPFSMTSHFDDVILSMPRHLMIINNQSSVSVYPWQQRLESPSTILECFWCSFLYKLLVTTSEDNSLHIYDFISIIDSIKLRGEPLSVKHQSYYLKQKNSSLLLPSSSHYQPTPAIWSKTRFTKSNSLGIYYCYISDRQYSCMLTRIDHNTRKHVKAIDCSGGSNNNNTRICAMGLSEERVAIVLTNLIMTLYDAETLLGLHQINLSRHNGYSIAGISSLMYLWKTWIILDPIENKIVGIGKRKRRFVKILPEQPVNTCLMENGTLALWLGYPGALFYYRSIE